jgi:hypothetical protein
MHPGKSWCEPFQNFFPLAAQSVPSVTVVSCELA